MLVNIFEMFEIFVLKRVLNYQHTLNKKIWLITYCLLFLYRTHINTFVITTLFIYQTWNYRTVLGTLQRFTYLHSLNIIKCVTETRFQSLYKLNDHVIIFNQIIIILFNNIFISISFWHVIQKKHTMLPTSIWCESLDLLFRVIKLFKKKSQMFSGKRGSLGPPPKLLKKQLTPSLFMQKAAQCWPCSVDGSVLKISIAV